MFAVIACVLIPAIAASQTASTPKKKDAAARVQMRNVKYRFSDNVAVHIRSLDGALIPTDDHEFPVLDDKSSFKIHIDTAEIAVSPADLGNFLNSYVFARAHAPLADVSISIVHGQLQVKGKLHDKGDIPFETVGTLSATPDGKVRLHNEKFKALRMPVKGLMDIFGVDVDDLIKTGKVPGIQAEENDLILDLEQILPPPHMEGKVTAIGIAGNVIVQTFGGSDNRPADRPQNANYMSCQGNQLRFGKLTMADADIVLNDLDPKDPLDFYLDHYKEQLAAGYTKITTSFQLRGYLKDFDKLGKAKPSTKDNAN